MVTPTNVSYSAGSGETIYAGLFDPGVQPAWLAAHPALFEWFEIPGTSGADGAAVDAYCGMALKQATAEIIVALSGGHLDSYDNRVSSISLLDDAPAWVRRHEPTPAGQVLANQSYNADGLPASRHTRYQCIYVPQLNRLIMLGSPSLYGGSVVSSTESNGFDLATNTWDAAGTWTPTANGGSYGSAVDDLGNIWLRGGGKWLRETDTIVSTAVVRAPNMWDPVRRHLFTMYTGDGQGFGTDFVAKTVHETTGVGTNITFNDSAAYTEFRALSLSYCAMTYNPLNGRYLYYFGQGANQGVIYEVAPNDTTVWDMAKIVQGAGTILPVAAPSAGIQTKFQYVAALKGIVMLARKTSNLYFMRLE